jgi:hypothetical protein
MFGQVLPSDDDPIQVVGMYGRLCALRRRCAWRCAR